MPRTSFEELRVYQHAEELADLVWDMATKWQIFARDTVGKQLVRAADSIGANIAEGTGRGTFADNKRFAKIARGSLYETKHWLRRAYRRKLIAAEQVNAIRSFTDKLGPELNAYISSIGRATKTRRNAPPTNDK
jgi:four helix bundle protein